MADIELVIKLPEESYKFAQECKSKGSSRHSWNLSHDDIVLMIANGTQLPKGHGDLIDRKELKKDIYTTTEWNGDVHRIIYEASVDDALPIVEADKEMTKEEEKETDDLER